MTGADEAAIDADLKRMVDAQQEAEAQAGSKHHVSPLHAVRHRRPPTLPFPTPHTHTRTPSDVQLRLGRFRSESKLGPTSLQAHGEASGNTPTWNACWR